MPAEPTEPTVTAVDDPRAMRALAHPLRMRLLGELRARGPQPVGALAERFGVAPGSASYHLRTLAEHGFVVEAPEQARDGRERWWRAAAEFTSWDPAQAHGDPGRRAALEVLRRTSWHLYMHELDRALAAEPELPLEWVAAGFQGDDRLDLTVAELYELRGELTELFARWHERSDGARPGAEPVLLIGHAFRKAPGTRTDDARTDEQSP